MAMQHHNAMLPGTAKFQSRPSSPPFAGFSPPSDYPHPQDQVAPVHMHQQALEQQRLQHHQQQQQHQQQQHQMAQNHFHSMAGRHSGRNMTATASMKKRSASSSRGQHMVNSNTMAGGMISAVGAGSLGHHRGDLIFPDESDTIEFCMPPQPGSSNGIGHGISSELLLTHGKNGLCTGEAFAERRRRGHSRRSNHKMDVEHQVRI